MKALRCRQENGQYGSAIRFGVGTAANTAALNPTPVTRDWLWGWLAETEGFEPSVPNYQYDGLANRWFQPLTHVSVPMAAGGRIARRSGGCNANSAYGKTPFQTRTAPVLTRVTARSLCTLHDRH